MASSRRDNDNAPTPCQLSRIGIAPAATYRALLSPAAHLLMFWDENLNQVYIFYKYDSSVPKTFGEAIKKPTQYISCRQSQ